MADLETQLRRYVKAVMAKVEPVRLEEIELPTQVRRAERATSPASSMTPGRRLARRAALVGVVVIVVIALLVVTFALVVRDHGRGDVVAGPGRAIPKRAVAALDGRLVVIDSKTGRVVRTLVEGTDAEGLGGVAVSPDSKTVYFSRVAIGGSCPVPRNQIAKVPIGGGPVEFVVLGADPKISRDGRWLAYSLAPFEASDPGCNSRFNGIGTYDLTNMRGDRLVGLEGSAAGAKPLSWSRRGQVAVVVFNADGEATRYFILTPGSPPETAPHPEEPLPLPPRDVVLQAYRGDSNQFLALRATKTARRDLVVFDAATASVTRTVADLGTQGLFVLDADTSGRHVLLAGGDRKRLTLFRIDDHARPTQLRAGVSAAAWIPQAASPQPKQLTLRDVRGTNATPARRQLEASGLSVTVEYRGPLPNQQPGQVAAQDPTPGTRLKMGSRVTLVVDMFAPCGGFFRPTTLPQGFDPRPKTGPAPEAAAHNVSVTTQGQQFVLHYTDGDRRSIEIRRPPLLDLLPRLLSSQRVTRRDSHSSINAPRCGNRHT